MSDKTEKGIRILSKAIRKPSKKKPSAAEGLGTVKRVDGDTLWVQLAGSDIETPIARTVDASPGDRILVRRSKGRAWAIGNSTEPPTGDRRVREVSVKVDETVAKVDKINETLEPTVETVTELSETAVTGIEVQYAVGTSSEDPPETGWSTDTPVWQPDRYIWQRTVSTINGEQFVSNVACIQGAEGPSGATGAQGATGATGAQGATGATGATGASVTGFTEYYAINNSTTPPDWDEFGPNVLTPTADNIYLWNFERVSYSDGNHTDSARHILMTYNPGATGRGVARIIEYYARTEAASPEPDDSAFGTTPVLPTPQYKYLWNYELTEYTDGLNPTRTPKRVMYAYGETGAQGATGATGAQGVTGATGAQGVTGATGAQGATGATGAQGVTGATGAQGATGATGATGETGDNGVTYTPSVSSAGVISWTNDGGLPNPSNINIKGPTGATGAQGATGATGSTGEKGRSIVSITPEYCLSSTDGTVPTGTWKTSPDPYIDGYFYYTRSKIVWSNPTETTYVPGENGAIDGALTAMNSNAYAALVQAGDAEDIATATNQHFWKDDSGLHIASSAQTPAATRNSIWTDIGILFRKGIYPIIGILTGNSPSLTIWDGAWNGENDDSAHRVAKFGSNVVIGKEGESHVIIDSDGTQFYTSNGTVTSMTCEIASEGNSRTATFRTRLTVSANDSVTTTFGVRPPNGTDIKLNNTSRFTAGQSSIYNNGTSNYKVKYDGKKTFEITNNGSSSVTLTFRFSMSIIAPYFTFGTRNGIAGDHSIAAGEGVIASKPNQFVAGKFNNEDTNGDYAFIVGNGSDVDNPSDAFKVDWNGNVDIASGAKYKINGSNLVPSDVGIADYITSKGKSGDWYYEKWASGKVEAWGSASTGTLTMNGSGQLYRATGVSIAIPSGIFSSTPTFAQASAQYGSGAVFIAAMASPTSSTALTCQIWKSTNANASVALKFHVVYYPSTY